ncbi:MAG: DUF559 domain-containing protein [Prevotella sp.]|nr:DUF559 domain-containing protein [Prevotella sp.]
MHFSNLPETKDYRRLLRKNETPSERLLWHFLRNKQLDGYRFRQQHGFGPYVLDFYCPELRLCIELDGAVHDDPVQKEKDRERTLFLNQSRIYVLRFKNEELEDHVELVLKRIREYIKNEIQEHRPVNRPPTF